MEENQSLDETKSNLFDVLPDELLLHIFGFFKPSERKNINLVCDRFNSINTLPPVLFDYKQIPFFQSVSLENAEEFKSGYRYKPFPRMICLAITSEDFTSLAFFDWRTGKTLKTHCSGKDVRCATTPDGNYGLVLCGKRRFLYNIQTGEIIKEWKVQKPQNYVLQKCFLMPDLKETVNIRYNRQTRKDEITIENIETENVTKRFELAGDYGVSAQDGCTREYAFSSNMRFLVYCQTLAENPTLYVWDRKSGQNILAIENCSKFAFSADESSIFVLAKGEDIMNKKKTFSVSEFSLYYPEDKPKKFFLSVTHDDYMLIPTADRHCLIGITSGPTDNAHAIVWNAKTGDLVAFHNLKKTLENKEIVAVNSLKEGEIALCCRENPEGRLFQDRDYTLVLLKFPELKPENQEDTESKLTRERSLSY